jgi:hypothetical protein
MAFLGDALYVDFVQLDHVVRSRILFAERTFCEEEHIIITHTTQRTPIREVLRQNGPYRTSAWRRSRMVRKAISPAARNGISMAQPSFAQDCASMNTRNVGLGMVLIRYT